MRPPPPSSDPGQPNRAQVRKMGDRRAMSELTSSSGSSSENESHERRAPARVRRFPSSNNPQLHNDSSESSGRESRLFVRKVSSSDDQQTTEKQRPVIQPGSPTHPIHCGHCGSEGSAVEERASSLQSSQEKAPSEQKLPTPDKVRATESSLKCEDAVDKKGRLPRAHSSHSSRNRDLAAKISKDMVLASMAHCDLPRQPAPPPTSRRNKRHHKPVYKLYAFHWIEVGLRKALWYLGSAIGGYSTTLMIIPLVVFLLSLIGLAIHRENLTFMAPFGSLFFVSEPLIDTQHRIKVYPVEFNGTNPAYNALQRSSPVEFAVLLKTLSARDTMIKEQSVDAYIKLKQRLHALHVVHGEHVFDWEQLRREEGNERDVIEEILGSGTSIALTYPETVLSINGEKNLSRLFLGTAVGGVETDVDGAISRARALAMTNRLREDLNTDVLSDWDRAFQEQMYRTAEEVPSQGLATCWWSYGGFIDAVTQSSRDVYAWLGLSALLIVVLCALMCFAENSYKSKPILGLTIGLLSLVCAFGGFGIQFGSVGNFNSLVYPILFIVTGISILVMTTMLQAWRKYDNAAVHPTEKLSFVLSWDGPCMLFTEVILMASFLISGVSVEIPYLRYIFFALSASFFLLLIFTLLFFAVVFHLSGRRETKGVKWFRFWEQGDTHFPARLTQEYDIANLNKIHDKLVDLKPNFARLFGSSMARVHMRYISVLLFAFYLIFATWGCTVAKIDLKEDHFLPANSHPRQYLDDFRSLFGRYEEYLELVFDEILDYNNPNTKQDIFELLEWAQEQQYATRAVSWLQDFARFEQSSIYVVNQDTFVPVVNLVFLTTEPFKRFAGDVAFDKYQSQIVGSRMYLELSIVGVNQRLDLISELMSRAKQRGLPLKIKAPFIFSLQHDLQTAPAVAVAAAVGLALLMVLSLLLFAQPVIAFMVAITCASVMVGVIGYSMLWSVPLNMITLGVAVAAHALPAAVVFHFCFHFAASGLRQGTGLERVEYAFQSCLFPVLAACTVPVIAYMPCCLVDTPIVHHIFKILLLVSASTLGHFLIVLPSMMIVLTENLPDCCEVFKSACEDSCCACCDIEEDAGSIYYIPTAGRSMDADTLRQFVNSRYGDSISVTEQYAIPAPPTRHMLLPPPEYLALSQPQILIPDVLPYGRRHNSRDGSIERPVRRNTPDNSGAYRVGPARSSASSTPQVNSPSVQRRSFAAQVDDGRSVEECIYEEPPSLVGSQPVYTTQQVGDDRERDRPVHDRRRHSMYEDDAFSMDSRYQHAHHQDPTIEMRPNWRQYLLDGAIRRHGDMPMGAPIIGMVQHSMPMCLAPAPLLPPPNMGHVIRYPRGLPRH